MANPHVGDVGAVIRLTSTTDISSVSTGRIYYRKPSGTTGFWTAALNGTTNLQYTTTQASDLDESGKWDLQGYAAISGWTGRSSQIQIQVDPNIE